MTPTAPLFTAAGPHVLMRDGPWEVRVGQTEADELLTIFERINAVKAHTSLYDACQAAGYIPTCSPIRPVRLVADNSAKSSSQRLRDMLMACPEVTGPDAA